MTDVHMSRQRLQEELEDQGRAVYRHMQAEAQLRARIARVEALIARREAEGVAEWGENYFLALDDVKDALDG